MLHSGSDVGKYTKREVLNMLLDTGTLHSFGSFVRKEHAVGECLLLSCPSVVPSSLRILLIFLAREQFTTP
jgi:hypothetical protein